MAKEDILLRNRLYTSIKNSCYIWFIKTYHFRGEWSMEHFTYKPPSLASWELEAEYKSLPLKVILSVRRDVHQQSNAVMLVTCISHAQSAWKFTCFILTTLSEPIWPSEFELEGFCFCEYPDSHTLP